MLLLIKSRLEELLVLQSSVFVLDQSQSRSSVSCACREAKVLSIGKLDGGLLCLGGHGSFLDQLLHDLFKLYLHLPGRLLNFLVLYDVCILMGVEPTALLVSELHQKHTFRPLITDGTSVVW